VTCLSPLQKASDWDWPAVLPGQWTFDASLSDYAVPLEGQRAAEDAACDLNRHLAQTLW